MARVRIEQASEIEGDVSARDWWKAASLSERREMLDLMAGVFGLRLVVTVFNPGEVSEWFREEARRRGYAPVPAVPGGASDETDN